MKFILYSFIIITICAPTVWAIDQNDKKKTTQIAIKPDKNPSEVSEEVKRRQTIERGKSIAKRARRA